LLEAAQPLGARARLRWEQLHRDVAAETCIAGPIDLSHPPGAERRKQLIGAEQGAGRVVEAWLGALGHVPEEPFQAGIRLLRGDRPILLVHGMTREWQVKVIPAAPPSR